MRVLSLFNKLKNNKYMMRIYFIVLIAFFTLVTVFSAMMINNVGSIIIENESSNNQKILSQLKSNIEFMDNTIKDICKYLHNSNDVAYIMYDNSSDITGIVTRINRIKKTLTSTNPFIHSLYIYNKNVGGFYSTYNGLYYNDPVVTDHIKNNNIPILKPIMRKIEPEYKETQKSKYVFTYFMCASKDNLLNEMLVINVNPEWLIENISSIYNNNPNEGEYILIYNNNGEYIGNEPSSLEFSKSIDEAYWEYMDTPDEKKKDSGYIIKKVGNEKYIYTFLYIDRLDMFLVKTQKYSDLFGFINKIKYSILIITAIILVLSVIIVFFISRAIYKPIGRLVTYVVSKNPISDISPEKDEITFLSNVYNSIINGLNDYEIQRLTYREEMKSQYMKKILYNTFTGDISKFAAELKKNGINISVDKEMVICIVSIDNSNEFRNKYNSKDRGLLKFCVINICEEIISQYFTVNGVDIEYNEKVVLIVNTDGSGEAFYKKLCSLIKECQEKIINFLKISVTVTISREIADLTDVSEEYSNVLRNSSYKYVFGRNSIITPEMIESNSNNPNQEIPVELKKKLEEEIRRGNINKIEEILDKISEEICKLDYNNIIVSSILMFNIIKDTVDETNKMSLKPISFDLSSVSHSILDAETIDDFKQAVLDSLKNIIELKSSIKKEDRHRVLVENIMDIIKSNYSDCNLCVDEIASMLKMSPRYIGRIFKETTGMTINEYINDVRITAASELLRNTTMSVAEISNNVGIENDTYFYSLFKKKYGVTPKEYAIKSSEMM